MLKIKLEFDVSELFDYDEDNDLYAFKNDEEVKEEILQYVKEQICQRISFNYLSDYRIAVLIKDFMKENKEEIIKQVVNKVSDKIIKNKAINDFKKELEKC